MNTKIKTILGIASFALLMCLTVFAYNTLQSGYKPNYGKNDPQTSAEAIDFTVTDVSGKSVKLSDFFGKRIIINFWASWCPPCVAELPDFEKVYSDKKNDVAFLMVDLTDGIRETVHTGKKFIDKLKYTFPVYFDTKQEAYQKYNITSIPRTVVIDKDNNIIYNKPGTVDEQTLRDLCEQ